MILRHGAEPLRFDELASALLTGRETAAPTAEGEALNLDALIAAHIRRVLGMTGGRIHGPGGAGELLGVNPNTLRHRMRKLGIPFRKDLRAETG